MQPVTRFINIFASLSLWLVTLLTFASVVMRFGFNSSLPDAFDMTRLAQGVALAWGIALATWNREHICIDVPWSRFGPLIGRTVQVFADMTTAGFLAVLSWVMIIRAWKTIASGVATAELRWPLWPVNLVIAAGIIVALCYAISLLFTRNEASE